MEHKEREPMANRKGEDTERRRRCVGGKGVSMKKDAHGDLVWCQGKP